MSDSTRDLILLLADTKRLLGMRYAEWILGAPALEAGIACASMAQDEWGHGRLLYALLKEFGEEVDRIEHGRSPEEYRSIEALDRSPESWPEVVAINAFVDSAVTVQLQALTTSSYQPLRQRVNKLIDEEEFHAMHGAAWCRRLSGGDSSRPLIAEAAHAVVPVARRWFGTSGGSAALLAKEGVTDADADVLRARYAERIRP